MSQIKTFKGLIVDVVNKEIFKGIIEVIDDKIHNITKIDVQESQIIIPGLIDSHIHVESSMLIPSEFARIAVKHGTTACVCDPHELANVMGIDGVKFMIENGKKVPFKFYFGAPSCVPATGFETSGAVIDAHDIDTLLQMPEVSYLAEMMNFPGVLFNDESVMAKIALAKKYNKPIDGHAPGLTGEDAKKYIDAGISTDHECFSIDEAIEKIKYGMKILIREGSAAKNFEELIPLIEQYPESIMLCSDDKHPDDLIKGHINELVLRAMEMGYPLIEILRTVTYNPKHHYKLDAGLLQVGDKADIVIIDNLNDFNIIETIINGVSVYKNSQTILEKVDEKPVNAFNCEFISANDIALVATSEKIRVINAIEGQLITGATIENVKIFNGQAVSDVDNDVLKIVVLQRYQKSLPAAAFIKGFRLKTGAMASTIAHDSHNIIAVGTNDTDIVNAINLLIENKGGISAVSGQEKHILPLPYGGLMTDADASFVAQKYEQIDNIVKSYGTSMKAPFMTLAFMALLVIPELKLSDKGLFDGTKFAFTNLFV